MLKNKKGIVMLLAVVLIACAFITARHLFGKDFADEVKEPNHSEPVLSEESSSKINIGKLINNVNEINKLFISDEYDQNKSYTEEDINITYYKYTGNNVGEMISKINATYINSFNNGYFMMIMNEDEMYDLYVSKPEVCNSLIEISVNDVTYDEETDNEGFRVLSIEKPEESIGYQTTIDRDENGYYKITSLINTCKR